MAKQNAFTPYESTSGAFAAANEENATIQNRYMTAAATAETITPTVGSHLVRLCGTADFWYEIGATAVIPSSDETSGGSTFLPAGLERYIHLSGTATVLSVIAASAGDTINALFWD